MLCETCRANVGDLLTFPVSSRVTVTVCFSHRRVTSAFSLCSWLRRQPRLLSDGANFCTLASLFYLHGPVPQLYALNTVWSQLHTEHISCSQALGTAKFPSSTAHAGWWQTVNKSMQRRGDLFVQYLRFQVNSNKAQHRSPTLFAYYIHIQHNLHFPIRNPSLSGGGNETKSNLACSKLE